MQIAYYLSCNKESSYIFYECSYNIRGKIYLWQNQFHSPKLITKLAINIDWLSITNNKPFADPVTWYGINYAGTQITQWEFQNKGKSGWTGKSSFVLKVPLRYLRPSIIYSVPCDRILQRTILPF